MRKFREMIPWSRRDVLEPQEASSNPMLDLADRMNRIFDEFFGGIAPFAGGAGGGLAAAGCSDCRVDVVETDDAVRVEAELPGVDEKDVQLSVSRDVLSISGEKRSESRGEQDGWRRVERSFGAFHRTIPLPPGCDVDAAQAHFEKGVLTVEVPKKPEARRETRRIEIQHGA